MKPVSFNQWIKLQTHPLAPLWEARRGRLTRAAVERRAHDEYGQRDGVGAAFYDEYVFAVTTSIAAPSEGDKTLLDFDPSR